MIVGMNLGFGNREARHVLEQVRSWGCRSIRTDAYMAGGHGTTPQLVPLEVLHGYSEDAVALDLDVLWLVSQPLRTGVPDTDAMCRRAEAVASLPGTYAINGGWEGNDSKAMFSPKDMAAVGNALRAAVPAHVPVWLNLTNNTIRKSLEYVRDALDAGLAEHVGIDVHPYQTTNLFGMPNDAGFRSAPEMWRAWHALGRPLLAGEWGGTTARQTTGGVRIGGTRIGGRVVRYTDLDVARYIRQRLDEQRQMGVVRSYVFQLRDGLTSVLGERDRLYEHCHGCLTLDGSEKPCVESLRLFTGVAA